MTIVPFRRVVTGDDALDRAISVKMDAAGIQARRIVQRRMASETPAC